MRLLVPDLIQFKNLDKSINQVSSGYNKYNISKIYNISKHNLFLEKEIHMAQSQRSLVVYHEVKQKIV